MFSGAVVRKCATVAAAAGTLAVGQVASAQEQHAAQIAGYWHSDARWQSTIRSKTRPDSFWVGRMWGRIDATGKMRFDADNGCVALGLLQPFVGGWTGSASITNCQVADMNGRWSVSMGGGKPHLSLRFSANRSVTAGALDSYEVGGTFARYDPLGAGGSAQPGSVVAHGALQGGVQGAMQVQQRWASAAGQASYAGRVVAAIRPNIVAPEGVPQNAAMEIEIHANPSGTISTSRVVRSSGNRAWDAAVLQGVGKTSALPRDTDGRVPSSIVVRIGPDLR
jgi:TonB family protein